MRILAIGAHPDDVEFLCAGTLALYAAQGHEIFIAIATNGNVGSPTLEKNEWDDYCNKISEISNRLFNEGIPMSYHEHMGTIIQSKQDVDRLLDNTHDETSLLFDTGHILFSQGDYESMLKKYFLSSINGESLINFEDLYKVTELTFGIK